LLRHLPGAVSGDASIGKRLRVYSDAKLMRTLIASGWDVEMEHWPLLEILSLCLSYSGVGRSR
jgi:hypothetical protein